MANSEASLSLGIAASASPRPRCWTPRTGGPPRSVTAAGGVVWARTRKHLPFEAGDEADQVLRSTSTPTPPLMKSDQNGSNLIRTSAEPTPRLLAPSPHRPATRGHSSDRLRTLAHAPQCLGEFSSGRERQPRSAGPPGGQEPPNFPARTSDPRSARRPPASAPNSPSSQPTVHHPTFLNGVAIASC
jgi:hypothetical protein